jgi:hypothetical protein
MTEISDHDLKATALIVFKRHGRSSSYYARARAESLREEGAHTGAETWDKIAAIVAEWERAERTSDEGLN